MSDTIRTLAELTAAGVGAFRDRGKFISDEAAKAFIDALCEAEEVAIRSINAHIATMPA